MSSAFCYHAYEAITKGRTLHTLVKGAAHEQRMCGDGGDGEIKDETAHFHKWRMIWCGVKCMENAIKALWPMYGWLVYYTCG